MMNDSWFECTAVHSRTGQQLYSRVLADRLYGAYLIFGDWNSWKIGNVDIRKAKDTVGKHHGGKGDRYRPVNHERYSLNFKLCFGSKKEKAEARVKLMELDAAENKRKSE